MASVPRRQSLGDLERRLIGALLVDGRASWRAIAAALEEPERTIARRGAELIASGVVRVTGTRPRGTSIVVRAKSAPGMVRVATRALASRPDSTFAYVLTGASDSVCELFCPPQQMADLITEDLPGTPGILSSTTMPVLRYFKTVHDWQPGLVSDAVVRQLRVDPLAEAATRHDAPLDDVDDAIQAALARDGRASFADLGAAAGVSEVTARRRLDVLRSTGRTFIRAVVDPADIGLPVEALLWLRASPHEIESVGRALAAEPRVRYVAACLGEYQLLVDVTQPSIEALQRFIGGPWSASIAAMDSSLVVKAMKRSGVAYS